jgi:hypothetical protein
MQRPVVLVVPVVVLRKIQQIHPALHPRVMQVAPVNQQQHAPLQVVEEVLVQSVYKDLQNVLPNKILGVETVERESQAQLQVQLLDMQVAVEVDQTITAAQQPHVATAEAVLAIYMEPEMAQTQIKVLVATLERILDQVAAVVTTKAVAA